MNKYSEFEEDNIKKTEFINVFFKYISYWKWFIASIIICVTLAVIYTNYALPKYEITTSIILKDDQKGGGTTEMEAFKDMGLFTQKNNVDNELEILNKSILAQQAVRELGIYAGYTQIGTLQIVNLLGINVRSSNIGQFKEKVIYGDECPILVRLPDGMLDNMTKSIGFEILVHPYGEYEFFGSYLKKKYLVKASISDSQVTLPFGKVNITRGNFRPSEDMLVSVTLQSPLSKASELMSQIKMDLTSKTTSTVDITLTTSNVKLGKDFLNKLIDVFNRKDMEDQSKMATKTAQFIDDRLISLTNELGDVESKVESYKQNQGLTDIQSQSNMFIQQTGDLAQKRLQVETQLAIVSGLDDYLHKKENRYLLIPSSSGIESPGLSELINNYNNLVIQRNRLSRIASSSNQAMIDLNSQIESMFSTVQSSVRNERNNIQIGQKDLLSKNSENTAHIRAIPRQEKEYTEIKRQQGVKEALFLFLLQKKEEKYLNMSVVEPIAKLIDSVDSTGEPISPKKPMILLFSLFMGIIIPVLLIYARDLFRYQIENVEELEHFSIVPVLGEIPMIKKGGDLIIHENSTDSFTEMVRLLRTNLLFVLDSPEKKVINMVSSISGEGKTFVTINLAMSLAMLDKKVLVIGLDIRKPKLAEYLNLDNKTGITLFLSGHLAKEQLLRPSGLHPKLWVITAGPIPPNPNELLAKPLLDKLLADLREQYDYIVIDTAPIGIVSDSFSLKRLADVNLYVVRADFTPKKNIEEATALYKNKKLNDLYFILNSTDNKKHSYHYGFGKKYEYGYGSEKT
jgi:capsular exopolysaccharide synthesis family protein